MTPEVRIGLSPLPADPFWLQVEEAVHRRAQALRVELVPVSREEGPGLSPRDRSVRAEDLLGLELDALVGWPWAEDLAYTVLEAGLAIVHLAETSIRHKLSVAPRGLSEAARVLADYIAGQMEGRGHALVVGSQPREGRAGDDASRLAGLLQALARYPRLAVRHVATSSQPDEAGRQLQSALQRRDARPDAILGVSDSLALIARDAGRRLHLVDDGTLVAGINGEPQALAAISAGEMTATVVLSPHELGARAVELACHLANEGPPADLFDRRFQLVTAQNVAEVMSEQLLALSSLPRWLAEAGQQHQRQLLSQLQACLDIICRIQSRLDSYRQLRDIVELICREYGYDRARIYRWVEQEQRLFLIYPSSPGAMGVWYDLVDGSSPEPLALSARAGAAQTPRDRRGALTEPAADPGSLIIADGLGWIGEWYDVTGLSSNSVVDQVAGWATAESKAFADEFRARFGFRPSPSAAGLSYDYANMWIQIAREVVRASGGLSSETLTSFVRHRLLTGEWRYTQGCIMREYGYLPDTAPDPIVGPGHFTFSVLEYVDGEGTAIFPTESDEQDLPFTGEAPGTANGAPDGEATRVFRLGVLGPFSGPSALVGREMKGAVEMAFDKIRHQVGPYRIELVWIDSQADPGRAVPAYEEAIVAQGVQAGLLNWHTPVALACMQLAARYRIPHFFALGGGAGVNTVWRSDPDKYVYWLKGWPEPAKLTANYVQALEHAISRGLWQPAAKTAALWGEDTDWGRSFAQGLRMQLEAAGWKIAAECYFPQDQTDFVGWLTEIKEANPALLAGTASNPTTFAAFVDQAHRLGLERMFAWSPGSQPSIPLEESDILGRALLRNEPVSIRYRGQGMPPPGDGSPREGHPSSPAGGAPAGWRSPSPGAGTDARARLVLPIRHGEKVLGLIDLRSRRPTWHTRLELMGLQVLADQVGLAMWDAQLYGQEVQARAVAERSDQSKTRLLANVSHELRTPLNVILGYTQSALAAFQPYHADLPRTLLTDLQHIHRTSEHLLHMTDDLLDLTRGELAELELFARLIDPRPVLVEAFGAMADTVGAAGPQWHLRVPERLPLIKADPMRLRQVLDNLLRNAHKFTDRGEIVLGTEVAPPHLHIWVQDTGLGIPIDRQESIFEPFVTAQHPDARREGDGLGLSIVRQLVTLHHGLVTLDSQPGAGSTFHVYLPLPSLIGEPVVCPTRAQRVLVLVSAQPQPAQELSQFCRHRGLEIRTVGGTEDLEHVLQEVEPAVLAWDLTGSEARQWALMEQLRRVPSLCRLPFILYGQRGRAGPGVGLTSFLVKPIGAETLLEAIAALAPDAATGSVLIVEDDPLACSHFARLVGQACPGHTVLTAADGRAALAIMAREAPSLVMLDLGLPDVDGFEVLERMRSVEETRRVPVLIMSGRVLTSEDVRRLERHALVTVHSKGILSDDEVAAAVHRSLFGTEALPAQTGALVKRAVAYCHEHYAEALTRQQVARSVGVSENYLSQIFRRELGLSLWGYLTRYRIKQAELLLRYTPDSVTDVAFRVGFEDPSYFGRVFRKETGVSPSSYRAS